MEGEIEREREREREMFIKILSTERNAVNRSTENEVNEI